MTLYHAFELDTNTGRELPHVLYRHAVRKWYRDKGYTLLMIRRLEHEATGKKPDHSTILHSCRQAADRHMERIFAKVAVKASELRIDA
jgi:hypothetical protein